MQYNNDHVNRAYGTPEEIYKAGTDILGAAAGRLTRLFICNTRNRVLRNQERGRIDMRAVVADPWPVRKDIRTLKVKGRLDKAAVPIDRWRSDSNIFDVLPSWQLISKISRAQDAREGLPFKEHKDIYARLRAEFEELRELKISYRVPKSAFKFTQYDFAIT